MNNVLIYSLNCPECKELLEILKQNPHVAKTMEGYQVEELLEKDTLPSGVTHVPTVITATGENLTGIKVFKWVEHLKNTLNIPDNKEIEASSQGDLGSANISNGKSSSLGGAEINGNLGSDIVTEHFSSLGAKNGSDIDPDNYVSGKKMYGESTRGGLPNMNELIQKRKQALTSRV